MTIGIILHEIFAISPVYARAFMPMLIQGIKAGSLQTTQRQTMYPYIVNADGAHFNIQSGEEGIMVIPIKGEITKEDELCGTRGTISIANDIMQGNKMTNIKGFVLDIDSPGGMVSGTAAAAEVIYGSNKPVVTFGNGTMASAAVWLGSQADYVMVQNQTDRIGSIGTMVTVADFKGYLEKEGIQLHTIYATDSTDKNKDYYDIIGGNYDDYRTQTLDTINKQFIQSVSKARRNISSDALTGKMYFASEAIEKGLIDGVGSFSDAVNKAFELGKQTKTIFFL